METSFVKIYFFFDLITITGKNKQGPNVCLTYF